MANILKAVGDDFERDFRKKTVGFYLAAGAALLCIVAAVIYMAGFIGDRDLGSYYTAAVPALLIVGALLFVGLSLFKTTAPFAPALLGVFTLTAFCLVIRNSYMYLSTVFYGGISLDAIATIKFGFTGSLIFPFIALALALAGIIMKQRKEENDEQ